MDDATTHRSVQAIESKPLYHLRPGSKLLTVGSWGCGTRCRYCRNADVALARRPLASVLDRSAVVAEALALGVVGVAFSYNEPLVRAEQVAATCAEARSAGLETVVVSSGFATDAAVDLLAPHATAWRVDVKAVSETSARVVLGAGAPWGSAFLALRRLAAGGQHVEVSLTYSPEIHGDDELRRFGRAVTRALRDDAAVHLQPLLPAHRLRHVAPPRLEALTAARKVLNDEGLPHVYVHLLGGLALRTTWCRCGAALVVRDLDRVRVAVDDGRCPSCGAVAPGRLGTERSAPAE